MAAIDLSKAKIGDKFRMKLGWVVKYIDVDYNRIGSDIFLLEDEGGAKFYFFKYGNYMSIEEHNFDLVEQVFDETLDTIERDERINRDMQKIAEIADEERQELQRRQEVVELAERIFFSDRGNTYSFKECVEVAEHSVNIRNQYLKDGKLC